MISTFSLKKVIKVCMKAFCNV